jgi:hypothetical protein
MPFLQVSEVSVKIYPLLLGSLPSVPCTVNKNIPLRFHLKYKMYLTLPGFLYNFFSNLHNAMRLRT